MCEGYIDDIIIYSDTWKEHMHQLQEFLEKLSQAKLTANLVKSEFGKATVTYLGHVVGQGHVRPIQAKVEAIAGFPVPTSRKKLMRFIGMTGYYRKFCPNFSDVTASLTSLLSKKVKFTWSENCQRSFEKVKMLLQSAPVLIAPDFNKPFKLTVDASDLGAGAVLMQEHSGIDHPICYFSKKFLKHQKNYSTIEKETIALILALNHFDVYLITTFHPIQVFTDHNPLTFINRMKNNNQRLVRWRLSLQEYNLDIKHIRGKDNIVADSLSRINV